MFRGMRASAAVGAAVLALWLIPAPVQAIDIQRVISEKGIEAWLVEDHRVPMISLQLAFRGGSALDPSGKEGSASWCGLCSTGAGSLIPRVSRKLGIPSDQAASTDNFGGTSIPVADRDVAFDGCDAHGAALDQARASGSARSGIIQAAAE
jgi:zinc protease